MDRLCGWIRALCIALMLAPTAAASNDASAGFASQSRDAEAGRILDRRRCELPFDTYESWLGFVRERHEARSEHFDEAGFRVAYPRPSFVRLRDGSIECWSITYRSDGLRVAAYLVRPRGAAGRLLPAIIYNRGGNRDFGRLVFADLVEFADWARQGFVVLASQYRGSTGSEGNDEFGGADVNDVLNLFPLARSLGVDMSNVFMAGFSRGGLMTYLALKSGAPVNAAAVIGGPTDLALQAEYRPEMLRLYRELMPDFERRRHEHLRNRCALDFAERFDAPLLILHGGDDSRVPTAQALALAQRLSQLRKPFELVVYANDDHTLSNNVPDSRRRLVAWFRRHMR